jgi:hypothetical protein
VSTEPTFALPVVTGPILVLDAIMGGEMRLSALFVAAECGTLPPVVIEGREVPARVLLTCGSRALWRARFAVPAYGPSSYVWNGIRHDLAGLDDDLRLAFVSCNGEETGDLMRAGSERNAMWARLPRRHEEAPFALLLHGGDQIYADEATKGHPLSAGWPEEIPRDPSRGLTSFHGVTGVARLLWRR